MSTFEDKLHKANEILEELGRSDIPLDKSVQLYTQGMQLLQELRELLQEAKLEVQTIQKQVQTTQKEKE